MYYLSVNIIIAHC